MQPRAPEAMLCRPNSPQLARPWRPPEQPRAQLGLQVEVAGLTPGRHTALLLPGQCPGNLPSMGRLRQAELPAQGQAGVLLLLGGVDPQQHTPLCALHLQRRPIRPPRSRAAVTKRHRAVRQAGRQVSTWAGCALDHSQRAGCLPPPRSRYCTLLSYTHCRAFKTSSQGLKGHAEIRDQATSWML